MNNAMLRDRTPSAELRGYFGIDGIADVLCMGRLRRFEHVKRMRVDNWMKRCINVTVEGRAPRGRPRKAWQKVLSNNLRVKGCNTV